MTCYPIRSSEPDTIAARSMPKAGRGRRFGASSSRTIRSSAAESIFGKMFGGAFGRGRGRPGEGLGRGRREFRFDDLRRRAAGGAGAAPAGRRRGADRRYRLEVDFRRRRWAASSGWSWLGGRALEVVVPPGAEHGEHAAPQRSGRRRDRSAEPPGDALVEIAIRPHPSFTRKGHDVHVELPISVPEAVLGAGVAVPTIDGQVRMTVPAGSNSGPHAAAQRPRHRRSRMAAGATSTCGCSWSCRKRRISELEQWAGGTTTTSGAHHEPR